MTWPKDRVQTLKRLWSAGYSGGRIAKRLGITRNAVAGKVHRMGLVRDQRQPVHFIKGKKHGHFKEKWTNEAEALLVHLFAQGVSVDVISERISSQLRSRVTVYAVRARVLRLRKRGHPIPYRRPGRRPKKVRPGYGPAFVKRLSGQRRRSQTPSFSFRTVIDGIDDGPNRGGMANPVQEGFTAEGKPSQARNRTITLVESVATRKRIEVRADTLSEAV